MLIGKIVKSSSHINYVCQIYGPLEIEAPPDAAAYTFGHFVRVAVHSGLSDLTRLIDHTHGVTGGLLIQALIPGLPLPR